MSQAIDTKAAHAQFETTVDCGYLCNVDLLYFCSKAANWLATLAAPHSKNVLCPNLRVQFVCYPHLHMDFFQVLA